MKILIKNIRILVFSIPLLFAVSCEDYLDKSPDFDALTDQDVFGKYENFRSYADLVYTKLYTPFSGMYNGNAAGGNHLVSSSLCDETFPAILNGWPFEMYLSGDYQSVMEVNAAPVYSSNEKQSQAADFTLKWPLAWQGIVHCNNIVKNIVHLQDATEAQRDELIGQATFLRAYFYYELMIRWGGFEYLRENMNPAEVRALRREEVSVVVDEIAADCDAAAALLPDVWNDAQIGRPAKAAAMALKSRALLYGASPLFNPTNDTKKWQMAADASWDLIEYAQTSGLYHLIDCSDAHNIDVGYDANTKTFGADLYAFEPDELLAYRSIHLYNALNEEVIFNGYRDNELNWVNNGWRPITQHVVYMNNVKNAWYGWKGTSKGHGATQNMVDRFEMKNGYSVDDAESGYDPQNPYINRDPRFYANILFDNVECPGANGRTVYRSANTLPYDKKNQTARVESPFASHKDAPGVMNVTGYAVRKYWPYGWYNKQPNVYIQNVYFRLAEAYLNYAEAAFEGYGGIGGTSPGASLSALEAINVIRNRVGMPNVQDKYIADSEQMRERIRNERAVELCFENHRYWDIRRWKEAHLIENREVRVMNINDVGVTDEFPTGYRFDEDYMKINDQKYELVFEDKHYWWPLRRSETEVFDEFGQTPGW